MNRKKPTYPTKNYLRPLALVAAATLATAASAAVTWKNIQFGGFLSQGYLRSSNNNYPVDTTEGTFDFREEAVNASTTFGTHLRVGAQVFAQKLGKYGDDKPLLDWAVVDYNFRPEIGVQVGRLKYPRGLSSDVLDVDIVRPFILLPQSNYDIRLRDFQASFDGALVYGSLSLGAHSFDYKVFYGDIPIKKDSGVADFFNTTTLFKNPPGVSQIGLDTVRGATVKWNTPVSGLRVGLYYSYITNLSVSGAFAAVPSLTSNINLTKSEYQGVSTEYTRGLWTFSGEYLLNKIDTKITLPAVLQQPLIYGKSASRAYYLTAARRIGEKFEVGAYYSEVYNCYPAAGTTTAANERKDWTAAVRYDLNDHVLFKLEIHAISGTKDIFNVPDISNPPGTLRESMTLFAAKTTLSF